MTRTAERLGVVAIILAVGFGLTGCGERTQVVVYKQGKYQGKPDSLPWDNDPSQSLYTSSKWGKGDKAGWESALRTRTLSQNEYTRTE